MTKRLIPYILASFVVAFTVCGAIGYYMPMLAPLAAPLGMIIGAGGAFWGMSRG